MNDFTAMGGEPSGEPREKAEGRPSRMEEGEERTWASLCHAAAFAMLVLPSGGMVVGPLLVWLLKRQESAFVDRHGKEAVNFQLSMFIYLLVCIPLAFVLVGLLIGGALLLIDFICIIIASVKASHGEEYSYPLTLEFIK